MVPQITAWVGIMMAYVQTHGIKVGRKFGKFGNAVFSQKLEIFIWMMDLIHTLVLDALTRGALCQ
jgi:hypothetical protein